MRKVFSLSRHILLLTIFVLVTLSYNPSHAAMFGLFKGKDLHNALVEASELGNEKYVIKLLGEGYPVNGVDKEGNSALGRAAFRGYNRIARNLINYGADVNFQDKSGETPLHLAAKNGHSNVVRVLIQSGADAAIVNKQGLTALDHAINAIDVDSIALIDPSAVTVVSTEAAFPAVAAATAAAAGGGGISTGVLVAGGAAAAAGGVAAAAGGGGGGSGGGGSSSPAPNPAPSTPSNPAPPPAPAPESGLPSPTVSEFDDQYGLGQSKADAAYGLGYTGNGVVVAVVDSGIDLNHPDLQANIIAGGGTTFVSGTTSANDDQYHGTHVSGIIAASKNGLGIHGIAYNATILPIKVINSSGTGTIADVVSGINYAVGKAKVMNLSLGTTTDFVDIKTAITNAVDNGMLVVAAAGNDGAANPNYPARYAKDVNFIVNPDSSKTAKSGMVIAVGAVDSSNDIASFSNRCGDAKDYCLVAPGVSIYSTVDYSRYKLHYANVSGTSMADPHVSGAAAIVFEKALANGYGVALTGYQVGEILLTTATDLGDAGVDNVYGHGLLNIEDAIKPVGNSIIPLSSSALGSSISLENSSIASSAAFGDALNASGLAITFLDGYGRAYQAGFSSLANIETTKDFDQTMAYFGEPLFENTVEFSENLSFGFSHVVEREAETPEEENDQTARMFLTSQLSPNASLGFNFNAPVGEAFGIGILDYDTQAISNKNTLSNPFLGFVEEGNSLTSQMTFNDVTMRIASFYGSKEVNSNNISGSVSEFSTALNDRSAISLQTGFISEENSLLGSSMEGAFAIGSNTPTWFYTLAGEYDLSPSVKLFGKYSAGVTYVTARDQSLFTDFSSIHSNAFAVGAIKASNLKANDHLGIALSQPLRVNSGMASLNVPIARDIEGNIYRENYALHLAPSGREIDLEAFYSLPIEENTSLKTSAMYRHEPGHIKGSEAEGVFMLKLSHSF